MEPTPVFRRELGALFQSQVSLRGDFAKGRVQHAAVNPHMEPAWRGFRRAMGSSARAGAGGSLRCIFK